MVAEGAATASAPHHPLVDDHSGFTPVRRPAKPPVNDSPALPGHAPWTATRCHRLLRPISSRILQLRKEKKLSSSEQSRKSISGQEVKNESSCTTTRGNPVSTIPVDASVDKDPDWQPDGKPARKLKRTYSARDGGAPATTLRPAEKSRINILSGPRAQGARGGRQVGFDGLNHHELSSGTENSDDPSRKPALPAEHFPTCNNALRNSLRQLAKSTTGSWMLYEGLYNGLDALLRATTKSKPRPEKGAKSLFALCLGKMPAYIDVEQEWIKEEDPDSKEDAAEAIYADLESLSTAEGSGWKPLKEVVRAHGIHLIDMAIRDGTIPFAIACKFELLCWNSCAYKEVETLVSSILQSARPLQSLYEPSVCSTSYLVQVIRGLVIRTSSMQGGQSSLFRAVEETIKTNILALKYMGSEGINELWEQAKCCLAVQADDAISASELIRVVVQKSYWKSEAGSDLCALGERAGSGLLPWQQLRRSSEGDLANQCERGSQMSSTSGDEEGKGEATTRVVSDLVALACRTAGPLGQISFKSERAPGSCRNLLKAMALNALQNHEMEERTQGAVHVNGSVGAARRAMPLLALHLATSPPSTSPLSRLILPSRDDKAAIDLLSSFVCALARSAFVRRVDDQFAHMRHLVDRLLRLARTHHEALSAADIAVSAAFEFAETTALQAHLDWALETEEAVQTGLYRFPSDDDSTDEAARPVSHARTTASTFRWEASIGEWVTKTPLPKPRVAAQVPGPRFCVAVRVPAGKVSESGDATVAGDAGLESRCNSSSAASDESTSIVKRKRKRSGPSHLSWLSQQDQRIKRRRISARLSGPWSSKDRLEKTQDVPHDAAGRDELSSSHTLLSGTADHGPLKRGRGRPRKILRGRGRPPAPRVETKGASTLTQLVDICMDGSSDDELGL